MSIDSLKRVLMATKDKARGMRKEKLLGRMNPAAPEEPEAPLGDPPPEGSPMEESAELPAEAIAEGDAPAETPQGRPVDPSALAEIRALLARV